MSVCLWLWGEWFGIMLTGWGRANISSNMVFSKQTLHHDSCDTDKEQSSIFTVATSFIQDQYFTLSLLSEEAHMADYLSDQQVFHTSVVQL